MAFVQEFSSVRLDSSVCFPGGAPLFSLYRTLVFSHPDQVFLSMGNGPDSFWFCTVGVDS